MAYGVKIEEYLTGKHNWYTPGQYTDAARAFMGGITLDPASDKIANRTIKATNY
jgi:hypothetical protein